MAREWLESVRDARGPITSARDAAHGGTESDDTLHQDTVPP